MVNSQFGAAEMNRVAVHEVSLGNCGYNSDSIDSPIVNSPALALDMVVRIGRSELKSTCIAPKGALITCRVALIALYIVSSYKDIPLSIRTNKQLSYARHLVSWQLQSPRTKPSS